MQVERHQLMDILRSRGDEKTAQRAEQSLPQIVDLARDRYTTPAMRDRPERPGGLPVRRRPRRGNRRLNHQRARTRQSPMTRRAVPLRQHRPCERGARLDGPDDDTGLSGGSAAAVPGQRLTSEPRGTFQSGWTGRGLASHSLLRQSIDARAANRRLGRRPNARPLARASEEPVVDGSRCGAAAQRSCHVHSGTRRRR